MSRMGVYWYGTIEIVAGEVSQEPLEHLTRRADHAILER